MQSSRRLERKPDEPSSWGSLGRLVPDHKTIADFRKDNGRGLRQVCARFVELCREMGLLATPSTSDASHPGRRTIDVMILFDLMAMNDQPRKPVPGRAKNIVR